MRSSGKRTIYAHREAWEKANGRPIPAGMIVHHLCHNPPCVNPEHLALGTYADNSRAMRETGRQARGSRVSNARLNDEAVREMRLDRRTSLEWAALLGCSYGAVLNARSGKTWQHVDPPRWVGPLRVDPEEAKRRNDAATRRWRAANRERVNAAWRRRYHEKKAAAAHNLTGEE